MPDDGQDIIAHTADGAEHHFPAGTSPEVIDGAIKKYVTSQSPAAQPGAIQQKPGGPVYNTQTNPPPPKPPGGEAAFLSQGYDATKRFLKSFAGMDEPSPVAPPPPSIDETIGGPVYAGLKHIVGSSMDASNVGVDRFKKPGLGNKISGATEYLESGIPVLGPGLVKASEQFVNKKYPEALGTTANVAAQIAAPEMAEDTAAGMTRLGEKIKSGRQSLAESIVSPVVKRPVGATEADLKFGRDPARAVVGGGLRGSAEDALAKNAQNQQEIGNGITERLNLPEHSGKTVDFDSVVDSAYQNALKDAKGIPGQAEAVTKARDQILQDYGGGKKPLIEAFRDKSDIGKKTNWSTGGQFDKATNQLRVDIYRGMKDGINEQVPGIKDLNEQYADTMTAEKAFQRRIAEERGANLFSKAGIARSVANRGRLALGNIIGEQNPPQGLSAAGRSGLFPTPQGTQAPRMAGMLPPHPLEMPSSDLGLSEWRSGKPTMQGPRGALPAVGESTTSLSSVHEPAARTSTVAEPPAIKLDEGGRPGPIRTDENGTKYYVQKDAKTGRMTKVYVAEPVGQSVGGMSRGGDAGISPEAVSRPGVAYKVGKNGISYLGKDIDANLKDGEAVIRAMPDGTMKVVNTSGLSDAEALRKFGPKVKAARSGK